MDDFSRLKSEVFHKQKVLARIYEKYGKFSIAEYVDSWQLSPVSNGDQSSIFLEAIKKIGQPLYGGEVMDSVVDQLRRNFLLSTIDHHGIFGHPFFLNSNLIFSLRQAEFLVCLPTAGISLNNSSRPGCLMVAKPGGQLERFSFFADKHKTQTVLATQSFTKEDVSRVGRLITNNTQIIGSNKQQLMDFYRDVFMQERMLCLPRFVDQASVVSSAIWNRVFPEAPKLIYIPLEDVVIKLLSSVIAPDPSHILHKLFFTSQGWDRVSRHFQGSLGGFSSVHKGSFIFWGIDKNRRRVHLRHENGILKDHGMQVPPNLESILPLLHQGQLYPTSLACFLVLLYYNATCLGGFNQVNWLTGIKERFVELLREGGEGLLAERVSNAVTDNFAETNLAYSINPQGLVHKPAGVDIYLQNDPKIYGKFRVLASKIELGESIDSLLPEIYNVITHFTERDSKITKISESEILERMGTARKISSVLLS